MRSSSIHLQQVSNLYMAAAHNAREIVPEYLIGSGKRNVCTASARQVLSLYLKKIEEAQLNYFNRTKQKIQTKSEKYIWEAVINLDHFHRLDDIIALCKILVKRYQWQVLQIAIHRDEGHILESSQEKIYNYHAHVIFFMLNKEGIYQFKRRDFGKKQMSILQTLVAKALRMPRGRSKRETGKERLNHRQYRQVISEINQIKDEKEKEIEMVKQEIERLQALVNKNPQTIEENTTGIKIESVLSCNSDNPAAPNMSR